MERYTIFTPIELTDQSVADSFAEIESPEFAGDVNVANDVRAFIGILEEQEPVRNLRAQEAHLILENILLRYEHVLSNSSEPGFRHSNDVALATYIYLVSQRDQNLLPTLFARLGDRKILWWPNQFIRLFESDLRSVETESSSQVIGASSPYALIKLVELPSERLNILEFPGGLISAS